MTSPFKIGDIVTLAIGGPPMVVCELVPEADIDEQDGIDTCVLYTLRDSGRLQAFKLPSKVLTQVGTMEDNTIVLNGETGFYEIKEIKELREGK